MLHLQNKLIWIVISVCILLPAYVTAKENDAALDRLLAKSDNIRLTACSANYDEKPDERYYTLEASITKKYKLLALRKLFASKLWQWDEFTAAYKRDEMKYSSFEVVNIKCRDGNIELGEIRVSAGHDVWINQDYYGTIKSNVTPDFWKIFRDGPWKIWARKIPRE